MTSTKQELEAAFPGLRGTPFRVTSPKDPHHNCIAFAAGDKHRWWWPSMGNYWPKGAPRQVTVAAFEAAFATLGYQRCNSPTREAGFEKVVLYAKDTTPTHMARQRLERWHSKLGQGVDIIHDLCAVEGVVYGNAVAFFRRPAATTARKQRNKQKQKRGKQKRGKRR